MTTMDQPSRDDERRPNPDSGFEAHLSRRISPDVLWPRDTDSRFVDGAKMTVFIAPGSVMIDRGTHEEADGVDYTHSDRLFNSPAGDRWNEIEAKALEVTGRKDNTPQYFQEILRNALNDPSIKLVHILTGVDRSFGSPYHVYGYTTPDNDLVDA